jgi:hypothetical protein
MSAARSPNRAAETIGMPAGGRSPLPGYSWLLAAAAFLAVCWSAALLVLDLTTARPKLVSPDQILNSELVVIGRHAAGGETRVKIERVYRGRKEPGTEIHVVNLPDVRGLVDDQPYVFPLTPFRGDFVVTRFDRQQVPPLIYPAVPEVIEQVKLILLDARVDDDEAGAP